MARDSAFSVKVTWHSPFSFRAGRREQLGLVLGRESLRLYRRLGDRQLSRIINCGSSLSGDADSYEVSLTVMTTVTQSAFHQ